MTTFVGRQKELVDVLNQLLELDYDAIEAYRSAMARISDAADREQLGMFMADHERHTRELGALVRELGHEPSAGPDMKQLVTRGKVILGSFVGDTALLFAMRTNEDDTNTAYERAVARRDLTKGIREMLEHNLQDERRHRSWIKQRVEALRAA